MKARPRIAHRGTSLAHSFVHAVIPRRLDESEQRRLFERAGIVPGRCVYCGREATTEDHFRNLVRGRRPSGHFHTPDNVVPSCGTCNSSKGGRDWREWMFGEAKNAPKRRSVDDVKTLAGRLEAFERQSAAPRRSQGWMRAAAGEAAWDAYWAKLDSIQAELRAADDQARDIRERLASAFAEAGAGPAASRPPEPAGRRRVARRKAGDAAPMQDLIDHVSGATGLEPATARKAIGIVLDFVQKNAPPDTSAAVIDAVPGGRAAAAGAAEDEAEGGGTGAPGLMGLADRLMAEGVGMGSMGTLGRALFEGLRGRVGEAPVRAVLAAIPELEGVV